jgi:hypothetical protein
MSFIFVVQQQPVYFVVFFSPDGKRCPNFLTWLKHPVASALENGF